MLGNAGFQNKNVLFNNGYSATQLWVFKSDQAWDEEVVESGWQFFRKGKVAVAVKFASDQRSGLEVVLVGSGLDYDSFGAFKTAVKTNARITGISMTSSKGVTASEGSIDGDPPAAMRYTEVKLSKIADELMDDIDRDTVDWTDNFDATLKEPLFTPAKLPNLLLMGAEGIAVGMATKIPPHNLTELVGAICLMIDKAKKTVTAKEKKLMKPTDVPLSYDVTIDELLEHVKGPDFPTHGIIYGWNEIKQAYITGKGKVLIRAKVEEEELDKGRLSIVIRQLPYQVSKANLVEKIAHLVIDKKIVGISDLRDESDRDGIRVVIELKRDAQYKKVLNNLFKFTEMQTSFPINIVALVDGVPQTLGLHTILEHYLKHRVSVITRRTEHQLKQAKYRAHILEGYIIALDNIDEVVEIIKKAKDEPDAKAKLM
ncbi:hypothetical protein COS52_00650, partial [Candidatus Roizmanbacteria bacterium CG03_land_8_20_14_0_80_39_12]